MCVVDRQGKVGVGSSARFFVADSIVVRLQKGQELAEVVAEHTKSDVRAGLGMMGVITGMLERERLQRGRELFVWVESC
jgi:non-canonical (house-cleaning) NTP pyrophosphatase